MHINYTPPNTIKEFIRDFIPGKLFYNWAVGPVGSGKTTGNFFKLVYMAKLQKPSADGIRRTKCVVVRNTNNQLRDTTIASWGMWFREPEAGRWSLTDRTFHLKFDDVECDVLFRPLDTPQDVARVLSLEVTFAIIDEFVQIPQAIIDALSARCGRYPSEAVCEDGATNWGMWGASNTDTEDNWWYEYLHNDEVVQRVKINLDNYEEWSAKQRAQEANGDDMRERNGRNVRYFLQPSGFSPQAENIEFLPGKRGYYTEQAKGKSQGWIKQFIEAEWGFSASGKPVASTFQPGLHTKSGLIFAPQLKLAAGFDPGITGTAIIFGQQDLMGRLNVLGELQRTGFGTERLIREAVKPYMARNFPDADLTFAPDPAANNRTQTNEKTVVDILRKFFDVHTETNNRLAIRLNAIEHYTTRLVDGRPALAVDPDKCPNLMRALRGGWRYVVVDKGAGVKVIEPDKGSPHSHSGDAFGYLCRYFQAGVIKTEKRKKIQMAVQPPPKYFFQ